MSSLEERLARYHTPAASPLRADDALKYAAAVLADHWSWVSESISCSEECGSAEEYGDDVHRHALAAMRSVVDEIRDLASRVGDMHRYADGRRVSTCVELSHGLSFGHIWHPKVVEEEPRHQGGELPSDPGVPSPGRWEVQTDPATQKIYGRITSA
ncbi:hypothetical protein CRM90_12005 [Mycobacterium sp. ENV421]|uniref:hypothetical protein n=1 Tax=Mycobacterium sp. ENV421 TaxID=1213407 RepID=UPI000C9BA723|nr:hypothetical protein [Mycobacterium sp. ENV421]PND57694.1 hypothetical protein CRM90_12005 [Mycobacterium sp. ENV421]